MTTKSVTTTLDGLKPQTAQISINAKLIEHVLPCKNNTDIHTILKDSQLLNVWI